MALPEMKRRSSHANPSLSPMSPSHLSASKNAPDVPELELWERLGRSPASTPNGLRLAMLRRRNNKTDDATWPTSSDSRSWDWENRFVFTLSGQAWLFMSNIQACIVILQTLDSIANCSFYNHRLASLSKNLYLKFALLREELRLDDVRRMAHWIKGGLLVLEVKKA